MFYGNMQCERDRNFRFVVLNEQYECGNLNDDCIGCCFTSLSMISSQGMYLRISTRHIFDEALEFFKSSHVHDEN